MPRPLAWTIGTSGFVLALDRARGAVVDAQVLAPEVEQRVEVTAGDPESVDLGDEQLVVADGIGLDDPALQRAERPVDERQAGRAGAPARPAELLTAGADRRMGEAVGQGLLVVAEDV